MSPDPARLRATVEHLASIERPSASEGERRAAEWIRDELRSLGVPAWVEEEPAVGSFHLPLALLSAAGVAAGLAGRPGAAAGALASAGIADDVSGGPHLFRRLLPHRTAYNVVGEAGDRDAAQTIVFVAHHDAAHGGLIFRPELLTLVADAAQLAGVPLRRGLRSGLATDALIAHRAGYPTATIASINEYKMPDNYHSQRDVAANVDYATVAAAARVSEAAVRSLASG